MPVKKRGPKPTAVEVAIDDPSSYMRFVATAAVDLLGCSSRAEAAEILGMEPSNLSAQLSRDKGPTVEFLSKVESHYLATGNRLHGGEPWLTSFDQELRAAIERDEETDRLGPPDPLLPGATQRRGGKAGTKRTTNGDRAGGGVRDTVHVPAAWFKGLPDRASENTTEVWVRGHALRSLLAASHRRNSHEILKGLGLEPRAKATVNDLLDVAGGPPHTGLEAVRLLADLAAFASGGVQKLILDEVERFIHTSPVGFRAVRVLGRILYLQRAVEVPDQELLHVVGGKLKKIYTEPPLDPDRARSLLVEALRFAPDRDDDDWAWTTEALVARTELGALLAGSEPTRPTRERVYAAYVLFKRDKDDQARQVMEAFRGAADEGLSYAAAFLDMLFKKRGLTEEEIRRRYPYPWPVDRPEHGVVEVATYLLATASDQEVPHSIKEGLRELLRGALLTIDGTTRRRICESIQAAGLARSAVKGLEAVITNEKSPCWLVEHAAFITGYIQTGYSDGSDYAINVLAPLVEDRSNVSAVRHAALWGIGDIVGSVGNTNHESRVTSLLALCAEPKEDDRWVRCAAAYTAAMLFRRPNAAKRKAGRDASDVLDGLKDDADDLVKKLANWGLEKRGPNLTRDP